MTAFRRVPMMVIMILFIHIVAYADNLQDGYSGIKWGTGIENLKYFQKVGSKGKVDYYINPGVVHTFDNTDILHVTYGFYEGRFFSVFAHIDTLEVFAQIKNYIQSRYGIPVVKYTSETGEPSIYRWKKENLKIKLKVQKYTGKMKLALYYSPISKLVNESQQDKYNEAGIKFLPKHKPVTPTHVPLLEF